MTTFLLRPPSPQTLKKYGLTAELWYNILERQSGLCPICNREFTEKMRPVVDHFHAKGFKKMKPEQKRKHVRGLVCLYDNWEVVRKTTTEKAYNTWLYLKQFDDRRSDVENS